MHVGGLAVLVLSQCQVVSTGHLSERILKSFGDHQEIITCHNEILRITSHNSLTAVEPIQRLRLGSPVPVLPNRSATEINGPTGNWGFGGIKEFKGLLAVDEPPVLPVWGARWRVFPYARERDKLSVSNHKQKKRLFVHNQFRAKGRRTECVPADIQGTSGCRQGATPVQESCCWAASTWKHSNGRAGFSGEAG
ncbi:hypothetical protein B0T21DRAFT_345854 [Apiosordaria backusii]|uniref:Uncharacterized protein n=1 Tax=Apiosordaria backusii TaxID=314023 RepID=A0AA40EME5_9PEZI|nr:hypothetical protein B0T21DRAFT_345854 [Apiosordaria backusii]